jgi:hypothetical protein
MKSFKIRLVKEVLLPGYLVIQIFGLFAGCLTALLLISPFGVYSIMATLLYFFIFGLIVSCIPAMIYSVIFFVILYFLKKKGISNIAICLLSILLMIIILTVFILIDSYDASGRFCMRWNEFQSPYVIISILAGHLGAGTMLYRFEKVIEQSNTKLS